MDNRPVYKNFLRHHFLMERPRNEAWTRKEVCEAICYEGNDIFIFVFSPSHQWIFQGERTEMDQNEFCDWLETVSGVEIVERGSWPDLELKNEPQANWQDLAEEMPCRVGPGLWDRLSSKEVRRFIRGDELPGDIKQRGKPDKIH